MTEARYTVQSFIKGIAEHILRQNYHSERLLTNDSVVLRKRNRDLNDNDRFSAFGANGSWIADMDTQSLWSLNIVKPMIRTNAAAMQSANVRVTAAPRFIKDSESQMASDVANTIIEQKDRLEWTSFLEEYIAQEQQLGPGVFVRTRHNPTLNKKHKVEQWEAIDIPVPGEAVCGQCGTITPIEGEVEEITACENCGGIAAVEKMPTTAQQDVFAGYEEVRTGDTETLVFPFFEFRVDDENTQGGNLENARWFEHHYIASVDELQLEYPESRDEIAGASQELSYSLQWQQCLKRNRLTIGDSAEFVVDQREVRDIFLTPAMYLNHPFTEKFELKDKEGNIRISVDAEKTMATAIFEGEEQSPDTIWCFRLVGNSLLDVFPCNFKEEFRYITWAMNTSSFWGGFLYEVVSLQDIINYCLTVQFYHIRRNAITSIVYNRRAYNPESFEEDLIPSSDNVPMDIPIGNTFGVIPALTLSGEPMQMITALMAMKQDVTLTTPAMQGQAQPNEPYHAQLLQKQSSLGLLATAERSKALAKVGTAKQWLRCAKKYWTDEDTEELLKLNSEWSEDHIQAFLDCDIDQDLIVNFVAGSDVPQSLIEREVKLQNLLQQLMALGQVAPEFVNPTMLNEILSELTEATGVDIDVNNNESNERLAETRYDQLMMMVKEVPPVNDPMMISALVQQIISLPNFQPLPNEGFEVIIEFYADKCRAEAAKDNLNMLLIACLNALIALEQQAMVAQGQLKMQMQLAIQAPAMQQQEQQIAQQQEQEAQASAQEQEMAQADKQQQIEETERGREHEKELRLVDALENERGRAHELEVAETTAKARGNGNGR